MTLYQRSRTDKLNEDERHWAQFKAIQAAAIKYCERGWKPLPLPPGFKHPKQCSWPTMTVTLDNVRKHFMPWIKNIAVQMGPVSNDLVDVDLDCKEARALAPHFLPPTGAKFGRKSTPGAHWLYYSDIWQVADAVSASFDDPVQQTGNKDAEDDDGGHGARLVELWTGRLEQGEVKGAATLFPPSFHPTSGERIRWEEDGEPGRPTREELLCGVAKIAVGALLVRHYPPEGKRNDASLTICGFLARAGWEVEEIAHFIESVAKVAGDQEWRDRGKAAKGAVKRFKSGDKVAGFPKMKELFGDQIVKEIAKWLGLDNEPVVAQVPTKIIVDAPPRTIDEVRETFERWLLLKDVRPLYALLGAIAGTLLPGEPVWLGLVAPPSSAKTELLNSTVGLPTVIEATTLTMAAMLSGTPQKQQVRGATGGVLNLIGGLGIMMYKDFGSVLSMRHEARGEMLAFLREVYDGSVTRHLGTDGGKSLHWTGKCGFVFGCTPVIDQHYAVLGAMGDRFLLCRTAPSPKGQFKRALEHVGDKGRQMRNELAQAVAGLFAAPRKEPQPLTPDEIERLDRVISLVVRLRGAVTRDSHSKEIEAVPGAEGTARLGLGLERVLLGLDSLRLDRETAFRVITKIAMDSVPPDRLRAYRYLLKKCECKPAKTRQIAIALGLPTSTTRRRLEELAAYRVVRRHGRDKPGESDLWWTGPWGKPRKRTFKRPE
jgi:hypothetical protein